MLVCGGWRVGGSRVGEQSADVCPRSPFQAGSGLFAHSSMQAWWRKELGGMQASGWFHVQNGDATGLKEHLPPVLLQLGAGAALTFGSWQAG